MRLEQESREYPKRLKLADGNSKLTAAALLRHDATFGTGNKLTADDIQLDMDNDGKVQEMTAMTHKTFDTFASDWTGCTNVAFEKVLLKFKASRSGDKVNEKSGFCMEVK